MNGSKMWWPALGVVLSVCMAMLGGAGWIISRDDEKIATLQLRFESATQALATKIDGMQNRSDAKSEALVAKREAAEAGIASKVDVNATALRDAERRLTTVEVDQKDSSRSMDRLAGEIDKLRGVVGDLTTAAQRLNDLLPEKGEKR